MSAYWRKSRPYSLLAVECENVALLGEDTAFVIWLLHILLCVVLTCLALLSGNLLQGNCHTSKICTEILLTVTSCRRIKRAGWEGHRGTPWNQVGHQNHFCFQLSLGLEIDFNDRVVWLHCISFQKYAYYTCHEQHVHFFLQRQLSESCT